MSEGHDMGATPPDLPPRQPMPGPTPEEPATTRALRDQIARLEHLASAAAAVNPVVHEDGKPVVPSWRRATRGEVRWPVLIAIGVAIALQLSLPTDVMPQPRYLLPGVEALLLVVLLVLNPRHITRTSGPLRLSGLVLIALVSLGNGVAAANLVVLLVSGPARTGGSLLWAGASVYLTNVLVFALWFWELDRGGPAARAAGTRPFPDFLFPQMATPHVADPHWEPSFVDYLYIAFTNATTWGPADTQPLTRWAKLAMLLQSLIALVTIALVVARAVNILG
ncbi:DUF1345 domain-containing protein [Cellulomonas chengniuliangii]|uniref:DUF1345 domain-containing protein n=1 Tax=Cellulomonas chengniuliangii TaxID=2968084 RepID=UPI001D0DF17D|nr:DUF1345 domain-containing protein [Cellulomonas chengniuliangii]MCC2317263.1 DUF1345 domain-containing protein [Cellulomonas chengniuliangii]